MHHVILISFGCEESPFFGDFPLQVLVTVLLLTTWSNSRTSAPNEEPQEDGRTHALILHSSKALIIVLHMCSFAIGTVGARDVF